MVKLDLMGTETVLAPPMIAENDGVLNTKNLKIGPRKVLIANSVDSIKPLLTGAQPEVAELKIARLQAKIRKTLMADQLPPLEGQTKTAYEWSVRVQMLRQMLGPMFGRFQAEFLQPLVERCFGIVWRANIRSGYALIGEPPESMMGRDFTVRYLNPLARAQREEEIAGMDRFEADLAMTAQNTQDPAILDIYDWEEGKRTKGRMLGIDEKLIRDKRKLIAYREDKARAQQASQQQAIQAQGQVDTQAAMAQRLAKAA